MQNKRRKKSFVEESVFALWQLVFGTASLLELWLLLERRIFLLVFVFFTASHDRTFEALLGKFDFYFALVENPDGYEYSRSLIRYRNSDTKIIWRKKLLPSLHA